MIGSETCYLMRRDTTEGPGQWNDEGFFEAAPRPEAATLDDLPTFAASVQPATADEVQTLPEANRARENLTLYTRIELHAALNPRVAEGSDPVPPATPEGGRPADLVIVRSPRSGAFEVYEVIAVEWWRKVRPHYKAIVSRADETLLEVLGGEGA